MYSVVVGLKAEKVLDKLPNEYYKLISKHLLELEKDPRPFGYRKLTGFENLYRIRVGAYRIIYSIKDNVLTVEVIKIDHRRDVYR
ncbi:MAG: type II toxin-antitoxin system RelE/ParE family toxin [Bacteroidales bacterium]|nr:type II toxin-antitoxin system RelE/ParE family toxin [Bacteroidales bacterium]